MPIIIKKKKNEEWRYMHIIVAPLGIGPNEVFARYLHIKDGAIGMQVAQHLHHLVQDCC